MTDNYKEYMREYMRKRRAKWRSKGLCPGCGGIPKGDNTYCQDCIEKGTKRKQISRKSNEQKRENPN